MRGAAGILWHAPSVSFVPKEKTHSDTSCNTLFLHGMQTGLSHMKVRHTYNKWYFPQSICLFLLLCKNFGLIRKQRVFQLIHRLKEHKRWSRFRGGLKIYQKNHEEIFAGSYMKDGSRLFNKVCSSRTRDNGLKLKEDRFQLNTRNKFLLWWSWGMGTKKCWIPHPWKYSRSSYVGVWATWFNWKRLFTAEE